MGTPLDGKRRRDGQDACEGDRARQVQQVPSCARRKGHGRAVHCSRGPGGRPPAVAPSLSHRRDRRRAPRRERRRARATDRPGPGAGAAEQRPGAAFRPTGGRASRRPRRSRARATSPAPAPPARARRHCTAHRRAGRASALRRARTGPESAAPAPPNRWAGCDYDLRGSWQVSGTQTSPSQYPYSARINVRQYQNWLHIEQPQDGVSYYGVCRGDQMQLDVYQNGQFVGYQDGSIGLSGGGWGRVPGPPPRRPGIAPTGTARGRASAATGMTGGRASSAARG